MPYSVSYHRESPGLTVSTLPHTLQDCITHICEALCFGSQTSHRNASNEEGPMLGVTRHVWRMTGALVAVGQIQKLLEAQDSLALPQNLMAPAHGLFLTHVQYRDT
ncbi:hypothetical protein cypCar_00035229, partial [Cyprinus carpio]